MKNDVQVASFSSEDKLGQQVLQAIHNCRTKVARANSPDMELAEADSSPRKTWLLFPFLVNDAGLDTGFSISNVSLNPIRTAPKAGGVILHFYGANAPAIVDSSGTAGPQTIAMLRISTIGAGITYTGLISTMAPRFKGYVIAECNFSPARGFAMITDVGARNIAAGYLAEVMDESDALPTAVAPM